MKRPLSVLIAIFLFSTLRAQNSTFYFTTSDGVHLYVRTVGYGYPCLFLHGGPGLTSYYFEQTEAAEILQEHVRMIYFDQRGGGRSSSAPDTNYSMQRMVQDIEELRSYLGIDRWSIIGHSFGGLPMTAYAIAHPGRIHSLVYAECTIDFNTAVRSHIDNGTRLLEQVGDTFRVDKNLSGFDQLMSVHAELAKKGIEYKIMFRTQRAKDIDDSITARTTSHFNQDFQHHVWKLKDYWIDYTPYTSYITCPVLVITGTRDYAVGPDEYKRWRFPHEKVVLYDGAHFSFLEEPQWFVRQVLPFLVE